MTNKNPGSLVYGGPNWKFNDKRNSSTTILANGATFTGQGQLNDFPHVMVDVETDQDGVLYTEVSNDNTNWHVIAEDSYSISGGINFSKILTKGPRYFRVRFTNNSGSSQTYFRLYVYYGSLPDADLSNSVFASTGSGTTASPIIPETQIRFSDSSSIDAFGRARTSSPFGISDSKKITVRERNQWSEIVSGMIITYTGLTGTFQVGEEIRGALPATGIAIGTIESDNGSSSMNITCDHPDFVVGDTITGQTSGATATIATVDTGSYIEYNYDRSSVFLTVGQGSTDYAIRQQKRYNAYVPGKGQEILATFIMGAAEINRRRRVGFFDELNGVFLEQNGTTDVAVNIRTSATGTVDDATNRVIQSNWNVDTLDGSGDENNPSGISLDLSKSQILIIDFQWLGVGRVRIGFDIDGIVYYAHEYKNANSKSVVYMKTPTLPVRYEIANTGAVSGQANLEEVCCSVSSEGGYSLPGLEFAADSGISPRTVTTSLTPVFAIRLKNEYPAGEPNRRIARFLRATSFVGTNNAHIEVHHLHDPIDITATWTEIEDGSSVEYSTDISAVTGRPDHRILSNYVSSGTANKGTEKDIILEFINQHSFISQDYYSTASEMFVIYAQSFTSTAKVYSGIEWIEFE